MGRPENQIQWDLSQLTVWRDIAANNVAALTPRQLEIMNLVLDGHPSKNIAVDLGISQRTVEKHRAAIMKRTGSKSLPALARLALFAAWSSVDLSLLRSGTVVSGSSHAS